MVPRKALRPGVRKTPQEERQQAGRRISAIFGGILIGAALLWFIWLLARQSNPNLGSTTFPLIGPSASPTSSVNTPASLSTAGITLSPPAQGQEPQLNQQEALLLANQMQPQIAASAGAVSAQYALFSRTASTPSFHNVPIWLIHYQKIPEPHPDTSADPHASSTSHDLYVLLDANSGKELLVIWL